MRALLFATLLFACGPAAGVPYLRAYAAADRDYTAGRYLEAAAAQFRSELVERLAAGDERASETLATEAPNHAGADSWAGPDQQEMAGVDGLGHLAPPVELTARPSPGSG